MLRAGLSIKPAPRNSLTVHVLSLNIICWFTYLCHVIVVPRTGWGRIGLASKRLRSEGPTAAPVRRRPGGLTPYAPSRRGRER